VSKPSVPKFWKPAMWAVAIVAITVAIAAGAGKFSIKSKNGASSSAQPATVNAEQRGQIRASMNALPLGFEANEGQTDPQVKYTARGNGYSVFLTPTKTVFALTSGQHSNSAVSRVSGAQPQTAETRKSAVIDVQLLGGNPNPHITAGSELPGTINYYVGSDRKNWRTGVKQFASVAYRDVYPGVNMVFHGEQRQLEFDFVVAPGADAKTIGMGFGGAQKLATDESGNLVLTSSVGDVVLHKPVAYQEKDGKRENVEVAFDVKNHQRVGLQLGSYDQSRELVIDPSLTWATYLGGAAEDDAYAVAIDGSGNLYVTGQTKSTDFPFIAGAYSTSNKGVFDIFVTKVAANGSSLIYSTYIGGTGNDSGTAIALDGSGNAYVVGGTTTLGTGFPTTTGAFQTSFGGGSVDAFVLELASNGGSLMFSTLLGGDGDDVANGVAVDTTGVYVVGFTASTTFPVKAPAYQGSRIGISNGFVTKLMTSGSALSYSTYLGQGGDVATAVAVDSSGNAYVTGATPAPTFPTTAGAFQTTCGTGSNCNGGLSDAFVTKFNSTGSSPLYSTFLGGEMSDQGLAIALDSSGDAYVTGLTQSHSFPVKTGSVQTIFGGGIQDAFVTELNPTGTGLVYSTYLGGTLDDAGNSIAVDGSKNAYVTGQTNSADFPKALATQNALGGSRDGFVSEINAAGTSLLFSTYLGGSLDENVNASGGTLSPLGGIAVDSAGANIYVVGNTVSTDFPATPGSFQTTNKGGTDAFVAKYSTAASSGSFTVGNGALSNTSGHAGVSGNATITVTSTGGFNSAVQLACAVSPTVTHGPTCNFTNPAGGSVTPPANGTATATLNVVTTASSAALVRPDIHHNSGMLYALILPIFGFTLLGARARPAKGQRSKLLGLLFLGMVLASALVLPACGGGGGGGGGGTTTPTGTYTITVTGTSGATTATGTPTLTLTVN